MEEFGRYQRRTAYSMQYALAQTEKLALSLLFNSKSYSSLAVAVTYMNLLPEQPSDSDWQNLHDNRDIPVVQSWSADEFTSIQRNQTYDELVSRYCSYDICLEGSAVTLISPADIMAEVSAAGYASNTYVRLPSRERG